MIKTCHQWGHMIFRKWIQINWVSRLCRMQFSKLDNYYQMLELRLEKETTEKEDRFRKFKAQYCNFELFKSNLQLFVMRPILIDATLWNFLWFMSRDLQSFQNFKNIWQFIVKSKKSPANSETRVEYANITVSQFAH